MKLNSIFTDNMVLQARKPIKIFGTGKGTVEILFCDRRARTESREDQWQVQIPPMEYGGPYSMEICLNGSARILQNVMVGEVILCAGQSNFQFELHEDAISERAYQDNPLLRMFTVDRPEEGASIASQEKICQG